ncbi:atad3-b [Symbiodinium natans]|uniref:Atad3-b protein n=1 Tax=Symbiodinium natans TaxID=878477 RepID=A0A812TPV1_9DINO|nr:atad3-b [Symbiodinium natans]
MPSRPVTSFDAVADLCSKHSHRRIYPSKSSSSSGKDEKKAESITGKFDPSALERGAAALRELDTSPNAAKAFELTKMAEQTKQQELQKEIEQQQTMRQQAMLQRNQMDAEEKRKTISHQQEQERRTAEYKARLDSELYQNKLEDQQKQIDQQLQMQHEQFLRQEDMRKRNNLELEEEKRRTLQEQARLDREAAVARIPVHEMPDRHLPKSGLLLLATCRSMAKVITAPSNSITLIFYTNKATMASKLSTEQLQLAKWRLEHGETIQGRPFYDDPKFTKFCEAANAAEAQSKAAKDGSGRLFGEDLTPEVVEKFHFLFVNSSEGDKETLEAWKRFCDMLRETEKILGVIDAPLRDTGERATHHAAEAGHLQNLKWLHDNGADINATTAPAFSLSPDGDVSLGLTPTLVAASFGQTQALEFLKSAGCDLNLQRGDGATALDLALDQGHADTAAWLEANGAARGLK